MLRHGTKRAAFHAGNQGFKHTGEKESENWFDIAREYTEKWHHQQQIREAVDSPLLIEEKWLSPLVSTLIRGVPPVYNKHASNNESGPIEIYISGAIDDSWVLTKCNSEWQLFKDTNDNSKTRIKIDDETAWRLFTKNITEQEALKRIQISGNKQLGSLITKTVSYMK